VLVQRMVTQSKEVGKALNEVIFETFVQDELRGD